MVVQGLFFIIILESVLPVNTPSNLITFSQTAESPGMFYNQTAETLDATCVSFYTRIKITSYSYKQEDLQRDVLTPKEIQLNRTEYKHFLLAG